mmetsp:Transcript_25518/g.41390  ORF Transcript_25518/g.41390 Transcript_25518/m.41390 type:complete len:244 (+) Transcript_25518:253-984(+)
MPTHLVAPILVDVHIAGVWKVVLGDATDFAELLPDLQHKVGINDSRKLKPRVPVRHVCAVLGDVPNHLSRHARKFNPFPLFHQGSHPSRAGLFREGPEVHTSKAAALLVLNRILPIPWHWRHLTNQLQRNLRPRGLLEALRPRADDLLRCSVWIKTGCHDFCTFTTTILLVHNLPSTLQQQGNHLLGNLWLSCAAAALRRRQVEESVVIFIDQSCPMRPAAKQAPQLVDLKVLDSPNKLINLV